MRPGNPTFRPTKSRSDHASFAQNGSDAAAKAAHTGFELAKETGDNVKIVVVRELIKGSLGLPFAYYNQTVFDEYEARAQTLLDTAKAQAQAIGVDAEGEVVEGDPTHEIRAAATRTNPRMIVIGTHGWGPLRAFFLGSVASEVLRSAPCPVLCGAPGSRQSPGQPAS